MTARKIGGDVFRISQQQRDEKWANPCTRTLGTEDMPIREMCGGTAGNIRLRNARTPLQNRVKSV